MHRRHLVAQRYRLGYRQQIARALGPAEEGAQVGKGGQGADDRLLLVQGQP